MEKIEEEVEKVDIAERTRIRLAKYNIMQLHTMNHYVLRRIKIPTAHILVNLRLQQGHNDLC